MVTSPAYAREMPGIDPHALQAIAKICAPCWPAVRRLRYEPSPNYERRSSRRLGLRTVLGGRLFGRTRLPARAVLPHGFRRAAILSFPHSRPATSPPATATRWNHSVQSDGAALAFRRKAWTVDTLFYPPDLLGHGVRHALPHEYQFNALDQAESGDDRCAANASSVPAKRHTGTATGAWQNGQSIAAAARGLRLPLPVTSHRWRNADTNATPRTISQAVRTQAAGVFRCENAASNSSFGS